MMVLLLIGFFGVFFFGGMTRKNGKKEKNRDKIARFPQTL
jgi:hypothetical protein